MLTLASGGGVTPHLWGDSIYSVHFLYDVQHIDPQSEVLALCKYILIILICYVVMGSHHNYGVHSPMLHYDGGDTTIIEVIFLFIMRGVTPQLW